MKGHIARIFPSFIFPGQFEHVRVQVYTGNYTAGPRIVKSLVAGAAADIQDSIACFNPGKLHGISSQATQQRVNYGRIVKKQHVAGKKIISRWLTFF
jgi:hypothetical protein